LHFHAQSAATTLRYQFTREDIDIEGVRERLRRMAVRQLLGVQQGRGLPLLSEFRAPTSPERVEAAQR
jgi:hypothetical protein